MRNLFTLIAGVAAALTLAACQKTAATAVTAQDMAMGSPTAKVTMIEYASVSCPHCAKWNNEVFPAFKAKYVDTGKVRYIAREALTGDPAIAAAGFLTARCAGKDKYFQVVDAIYRGQEEMVRPASRTPCCSTSPGPPASPTPSSTPASRTKKPSPPSRRDGSITSRTTRSTPPRPS